MTRLQQFLTVTTVILALTGVQVIQASPLHDHLVHAAGCTLCHHDSTESVPVTGIKAPAAVIARYLFVILPKRSAAARLLSFSSRAPPLLTP